MNSRFPFGRRAALLYSVAAFLVMAVSAQAAPVIDTISVHGTGTPAGPYTTQDKYWTYAVFATDPTIDPGSLPLPAPVSGNGVSPAYIMDVNGWPIHNGPYAKPTHGEHWVGPKPTYTPSGYLTAQPGVYYVYQTSFYIPDSVNAATVMLAGGFSTDNCAVKIAINGTALTNPNITPGTCLSQTHPFEIGGAGANFGDTTGLYFATAAFHSGINTIQFVVYNTPESNPSSPNPSALMVWMTGYSYETPEASTAGLLIGGLGLVAWLRSRRQRS